MDMPLLCAGFAALSVTFMLLLDGFDLGVGALLLLQRHEKSRDHMVDSITPTWDGNETWLIMTGVTLQRRSDRIWHSHAGTLYSDHRDAAVIGSARSHI